MKKNPSDGLKIQENYMNTAKNMN